MKKNEELITKIAMRKMERKPLYDEELERRIMAVLKEKRSKTVEIERTKDVLDFL